MLSNYVLIFRYSSLLFNNSEILGIPEFYNMLIICLLGIKKIKIFHY